MYYHVYVIVARVTYHVQPMNIIGRQIDHMTNGEPSYGHLIQR